MKAYWTAWRRGVGICAFYFCLSLVVGAVGWLAGLLPLMLAVPLFIIVVPPAVFWMSRWIAPDLVREKAMQAGT